MSRSFRHTPIVGWTTCNSEKSDKRLDHRLQRVRLRTLLAHERYDEAEVDGPGLSIWLRGKDGKQRLDPWPQPLIIFVRGKWVAVESAEERRSRFLKALRK